MGETQNQPFQLSFNASLRVDFQGSRVTSDGGLILVRELDERWLRRTHRAIPDGLSGEECALALRRPAAAVGVQPLGGV